MPSAASRLDLFAMSISVYHARCKLVSSSSILPGAVGRRARNEGWDECLQRFSGRGVIPLHETLRVNLERIQPGFASAEQESSRRDIRKHA